MELDRVAAAGIFRIPRSKGPDTEDWTRPRSLSKLSTTVGVSGPLYLPVVKASLDVNIINTTSRTVLTHYFSNDNDEALPEAVYIFPLYDGSTIISFDCWVGGITITGSVEVKVEAQEKYKGAVSQKDMAIFFDEHTSEVFESSLGNIPARTKVRIEITYINELKPDIDGEGMILTIPSSIAPRYGTPPVNLLARIDSKLDTEPSMSIRVDLSMPLPIRKLESHTHLISVEIGSTRRSARANTFRDLATGASAANSDNKRARVTLSNNTPVDGKDFVLIILVDGSGLLAPRAVMETCLRHPNHSAIQVSFTPQALFRPKISKRSTATEIIFVADRSGSMTDKIAPLRRSMALFLLGLPEDNIYFNIASFGSTYSCLWPRSKKYGKDVLSAAQKHLQNDFLADMGGTELLAALKKAVEGRLADTVLSTEVLLLTDGQVWETDEVVAFVQLTKERYGDRIRFFALGIGDAISHKLVEGIGRFGGGFAEVVPAASTYKLDNPVGRMLKGALSPSSWDCHITLVPNHQKSITDLENASTPVDGLALPYVKAPYILPPINTYTRFSSYILIETSKQQYKSVTVQGCSSQGRHSIKIPIEHVQVSEPTLLSLSAKAILSDIEKGQSQFHKDAATGRQKSTAESAYIRSEAERIGKQWSLTSRWTSFVGISSSHKRRYPSKVHPKDLRELNQLTEHRGSYGLKPPAIDETEQEEDEVEAEDDEAITRDSDGGRDERRDDDDSGGAGHGNNSTEYGGPGNGHSESDQLPDSGGDDEGNNEGSGSSKGGRGYGQQRSRLSYHGMQEERGLNLDAENWERETVQEGEAQSDVDPLSKTPNTFDDVLNIPFSSTWLSAENSNQSTTSSKNGPGRVQWFQPIAGINRGVLMAETAREFGRGTVVGAGTYNDIKGFWITSDRGPDMHWEHNMKLLTEKWEEEVGESDTSVHYLLSQTYNNRQIGDWESTFNNTACAYLTPNFHSPQKQNSRNNEQSPPNLYSIAACYDYSGALSESSESNTVFEKLLETFKRDVQSLMKSKLEEHGTFTPKTIDNISKTIISYVYVRKAYAFCADAWELFIGKVENRIRNVGLAATLQAQLERVAIDSWMGTEVEDVVDDPAEDILMPPAHIWNYPPRPNGPRSVTPVPGSQLEPVHAAPVPSWVHHRRSRASGIDHQTFERPRMSHRSRGPPSYSPNRSYASYYDEQPRTLDYSSPRNRSPDRTSSQGFSMISYESRPAFYREPDSSLRYNETLRQTYSEIVSSQAGSIEAPSGAGVAGEWSDLAGPGHIQSH